MYREEDYLMISGIQHFLFCRRQWALIHVEQQWADNADTIIGELMHERVHDPLLREKRNDIRIVRALPVSSKRLGVSGECDAVEFHRAEEGVRLIGHRGYFQLYPIEYKKGKPKAGLEDVMQLVVQTMCLEEMFSTQIEAGALYYGKTRHRECVSMTAQLRTEAEQIIQEMHRYFDKGYTPVVEMSKKCRACSLKHACMPELEKVVSARKYVEKMLREGSE